MVDCDKDGNFTLGDVDPDGNSVGERMSCSTAEEDHYSACVICLEPFRVGDRVTWSKEMECQHVFHKDCIVEWLQNPKHDDCPSCRCNIIHSDDVSIDDPLQDDREDEEAADACQDQVNDHEATSANIAFVIINGLVSQARRTSCALIGSSVEMDQDNMPECKRPPPSPVLRKLVSEGLGSARNDHVSVIVAPPGAFPQVAAADSTDSAEAGESPFRRPSFLDGTSSLKTPSQSVLSEGPVYGSASTGVEEHPVGLVAGSGVALPSVCSRIYPRLSFTCDNTDNALPNDCDDVNDEENIPETEPRMCKDIAPGSRELTSHNADPEMGLAQSTHVHVSL